DIQFLPQSTSGRFYLVNSYKHSSQVFQISPSATSPPAPLVNGVGGSGSVLCSVYHPFAVAFDSAMAVCYIANQDSNVVVRVNGPNPPNPGQPMSINPALLGTSFLPGTFVASQVPLAPPGCPTPSAVPNDQGGLGASPPGLKPTETPSNSVRGVAVIDTTLYVADELDRYVRQYDTKSGKYLGAIGRLVLNPTHLLARDGLLYIGGSPSSSKAGSPSSSKAVVLCFNPTTETMSAVISNSDDLNVKHPSGMTFDGSGNFYLADLEARVVYQFDSQFSARPTQPFIPREAIPDSPEFILWVNDDWV